MLLNKPSLRSQSLTDDDIDAYEDMWLSRLKPELCAGKKVAHLFGAINVLAYFHKIQPKKKPTCFSLEQFKF